MSTTFDEPDHASEGHDPMCPRYVIDEAWQGAECQCDLIRLLRGMKDTDVLLVDTEATLARLEEKVIREIGEEEMLKRQRDRADMIMTGHDPLCPPGLKAAPFNECTWCVTIRQAREEGPLT